MGKPTNYLREKTHRSLLIPTAVKSLPKRGLSIPTKYRRSWSYQEKTTGRQFIGTFYPVNISPHPTDQLHTVEAGEVGRPDTISYKYYSTPELYWVILWVNGIADPFEALFPGVVLRVPTLQRIIELGVGA